MTDAEHIDALRRILIKKPRIGLRTALRSIAEREAIRVTTARLRAENARERDTARLQVLAGCMEGLI